MATVTLTRGTTLPDSSGKADFHALVDSASATVTNIVNADIDAAAAIADSKLAQITTASKVSVTAITGVLPNAQNIGGAIEVVFDGGGSAIAAATAVSIIAPKAIAITGAYMFSDVSCTAVVDVWKDTIANYPPTDADTITASAPITITAGTNSTDTTLTGWTKAVAALAVLKFNVDSNDSATKLTVVLTYDRA